MNVSTISNGVQSSMVLAALAKMTRNNTAQEDAFKEIISTLPADLKDSIYYKVMRFDTTTDLKTLIPVSTDRFKVYTAADALKPQPPIEWIVEGLFAKRTVSVIVGNPGSKKTYSMIDLAVCVTMGEPWLDHKTQKSSVLLIDEESGVRRINLRLRNTMRGQCADETIPFHFTSLSRFNFRTEDGDVSSSPDLLALKEIILQTKAKLVIIDALADVMPGADENSVKDVQPIFMALREIADVTESAIIVIHHANKGGSSYRGSTAILGALDVMMMVKSEPESPNIDFIVQKNRDGKPSNFAAVASFGPDQFYLTPSQSVGKSRISDTEVLVMSYLAENGDSYRRDISASAENISPASIGKAIQSLAKAGLIQRKDPGGPGKAAIYGLTDVEKAKMAPVM